jgi:hypothetical protein
MCVGGEVKQLERGGRLPLSELRQPHVQYSTWQHTCNHGSTTLFGENPGFGTAISFGDEKQNKANLMSNLKVAVPVSESRLKAVICPSPQAKADIVVYFMCQHTQDL